MTVNRAQVSVFGHSGAGCGTGNSGLYRIAQQTDTLAGQGITLRTLGLMDICFGGSARGSAVSTGLSGSPAKVIGMWVVPNDWGSFNRDVEGFRTGLGITQDAPGCDSARYDSCKTNAAGWRFYKAKSGTLASAFAGVSAHSGVPLWMMEETFKLYFAP